MHLRCNSEDQGRGHPSGEYGVKAVKPATGQAAGSVAVGFGGISVKYIAPTRTSTLSLTRRRRSSRQPQYNKRKTQLQWANLAVAFNTELLSRNGSTKQPRKGARGPEMPWRQKKGRAKQLKEPKEQEKC